jgi:hypothetical protein
VARRHRRALVALLLLLRCRPRPYLPSAPSWSPRHPAGSSTSGCSHCSAVSLHRLQVRRRRCHRAAAEPASSKRSLGDSRSAGPREVRRCRAGGGRRQRGNVAPSSAAGGPTRSSMPPPMHARMRGPCSAELAAMPRQLFLPCTRDWFAPAGTYGTRSCRYSLRAVKKHCEAHSAAGSS